MKKQISLMIAVLMFCFSFSLSYMETKAADDAKVQQTEIQPKGQYLQSGQSSIAAAGKGKIYVSGTTNAQKVVGTIKVSVIVEQKVGSSWYHYHSWTAQKHNDYEITSGKTLTVPRGHWYRVRCVHSANTDLTASNTGALYVK